MAARKKIKVIGFDQKNGKKVHLDLELGNERGNFDVSVVDRAGVFGLEFPDSLGLKLRNFPPEESRHLIEFVKRNYTRKLRAA